MLNVRISQYQHYNLLYFSRTDKICILQSGIFCPQSGRHLELPMVFEALHGVENKSNYKYKYE